MLRVSAAAVGGSEHNFGIDEFLTKSAFFFHNFNLTLILEYTVDAYTHFLLPEKFLNTRGLKYAKGDLSHFMQ